MQKLSKAFTFLILFLLSHTFYNCQCNKAVDDDSPAFEVAAKAEKAELTLDPKAPVTTKVMVTVTNPNSRAAQSEYEGTFSLYSNVQGCLSPQGNTSSITNVTQKLQEGENVFCYTPHNTGNHTLTISVI